MKRIALLTFLEEEKGVFAPCVISAVLFGIAYKVAGVPHAFGVVISLLIGALLWRIVGGARSKDKVKSVEGVFAIVVGVISVLLASRYGSVWGFVAGVCLANLFGRRSWSQDVLASSTVVSAGVLVIGPLAGVEKAVFITLTGLLAGALACFLGNIVSGKRGIVVAVIAMVVSLLALSRLSSVWLWYASMVGIGVGVLCWVLAWYYNDEKFRPYKVAQKAHAFWAGASEGGLVGLIVLSLGIVFAYMVGVSLGGSHGGIFGVVLASGGLLMLSAVPASKYQWEYLASTGAMISFVLFAVFQEVAMKSVELTRVINLARVEVVVAILIGAGIALVQMMRAKENLRFVPLIIGVVVVFMLHAEAAGALLVSSAMVACALALCAGFGGRVLKIDSNEIVSNALAWMKGVSVVILLIVPLL